MLAQGLSHVRRNVWVAAVLCAVGVAPATEPGAAPLPEIPPLPKTLVISRVRQEPKKGESGEAGADKKNGKRPAWKAWDPPGQKLTLGQCLQIGADNHPAVRAAAASLAASERGYLALHNLPRIAEFVTPDLCVRKQQSQRGVLAASAEVMKARQENTYDVTRLYFEYVRATQQEQTASDVVEQMEAFYDSAVEFLKLEVPDPRVKINEFTLGTLDGLIGEVRELRDRASTGRKKALNALQEAMAVDYQVVPADTELPLMTGVITQEQVVALALGRRAELTQAGALLEVTRLEVTAQAVQKRGVKVDTFASGSDLHARHLPAPLRNGEYRPGVVVPEMPNQLVGRVDDRVARACEYVRRMEAMHDGVVRLVRTEVVNSFLDWQAATEQVKDTRERHERQQKLVEKSRAASAAKMDPELLVRNESLASQAQARYVEAVYRQVLALIALERVTGGGVAPPFPGR